MKRVYYVVEANDGCQVSDKLDTLKEARKQLKEIIEEDKDEFDINEGDIDYYIMKYTETDDVLYWEEIK